MKHMFKIFIAVYLCMTIIMDCGEVGAEPDIGKEQAHLTIGLIPERNIFEQIERYQPLADYLSSKIGVTIQLKILTRYGNIIENFIYAQMDAAFFGSFTYSLAHAKIGVEPIARPVDQNGHSTYYGLIFVRKDSGIKSARDMQGKTFAFVDKATTAGYLLPLAYFKENGIENYKSFLKETYFSGTHQDVIYDVLNKKADIGAAKNTMFYRLALEDIRITDELAVLERSPDVPENGLAVRKGLDDAIKQKLKEALVNMHMSPEGRNILKNFGAQKFIETSDNDYASVYRYANEIGLNLSTYDYINE